MKQILIVSFLILTIVQSYAIIMLNKNKHKNDIRLKNKIEYLQTAKKVLFKQIVSTSQSVSIPFTFHDQVLETKDGKFIKLRDLFNSSPKIVFRISDHHCGECIVAQIPHIKKLGDSVGKNNVIILGSYENMKNLKIVMQSNKLDFEYYNIPYKTLSYLNIEMLSSPYFFEVENLKTRHVFLPEKNLPELSEAYVKNMIANY